MWKNICLVLVCGILVGCGSSSSKNKVTGKLLLEMSSQEVKDKLISDGWEDFGNSKIYGYKAYKISYVTKDEKDKNVNVSGLFVVPTEVDNKIKEDGISIVSYGHGTNSLNENAPTPYTEKHKELLEPAIIFSSLGGFATLQADYIGYGDSKEHYHPYVMKKSLVNASIDLVDAVKEFAKRNNIKLNDKLFVTGYSEGGYTAMATLQELEKKAISVTATAPLAGDYDLSYTAEIMFGTSGKNIVELEYTSLYLSFATLAYTKVYDKDITSVINSPYAQQIEKLFDKEHSFEQIESILPSKILGENGLMREDFINDYQNNENNWLKKALKKNSVDNWRPKTPLRIVHCEGDNQSPYLLAQKIYNQMINNGSTQVKLITLDTEQAENEKWDHDDCFLPSLIYTFLWFKEIRDQ